MFLRARSCRWLCRVKTELVPNGIPHRFGEKIRRKFLSDRKVTKLHGRDRRRKHPSTAFDTNEIAIRRILIPPQTGTGRNIDGAPWLRPIAHGQLGRGRLSQSVRGGPASASVADCAYITTTPVHEHKGSDNMALLFPPCKIS